MATWDTELARGYLAPLGLTEDWVCQWVSELSDDQGWTLQESAAFVAGLVGGPLGARPGASTAGPGSPERLSAGRPSRGDRAEQAGS